MYKIFIDGQQGTTGLTINSILKNNSQIELLEIPKEDSKNLDARIEIAKQSDITILCLPDEAAEEISKKLLNYNVRIIDCSTAHRVNPNWVYGFPELTKGQVDLIKNAKYVSNPGCYPTGALSLIRPLRDAELISDKSFLSIYAVSGYSGGGKSLIQQFNNLLEVKNYDKSFFTYGLQLNHKHNKEIKLHGKLSKAPVFIPSVCSIYQGMIVNIALSFDMFTKCDINANDVYEIYQSHFANCDKVIVADMEETNNIGKIYPSDSANTDYVKIHLFFDKKNRSVNLCATLDNLGKGAAEATIQNMKIMLSI